jgi:septum formation inhibitor MinC
MNILGILNKTKRKQSCLLLTEDGRILEIAPTVVRGYVAEHKTQEAWELYPDERIPKRGTNRLFQLITERDMAPLSLDGTSNKQSEKRAKKTLSQIAQESAAAARANLQKQSLKSKQAETIQLLIIILGITVSLLVLVSLFLSGKLGGGGGGGGSIFAALPAFLNTS